MSAVGRLLLLAILQDDRQLYGCDFNRSMQHLNSRYRDGDVENEAKTEDLLFRCTEGIDVGSVAARRFHVSFFEDFTS